MGIMKSLHITGGMINFREAAASEAGLVGNLLPLRKEESL